MCVKLHIMILSLYSIPLHSTPHSCSSQVSFSVEGEALGLSEVRVLLGEKADVLEALGFPVSDISQGRSRGVGPLCR